MMTRAYLDKLAEVAVVLRFIGLDDDVGNELTGQRYRRQRAGWIVDGEGTASLLGDLTFTVPPGSVIAGWRGYSDEVDGEDFGGASLTEERFNGEGRYTLLANQTGVRHEAA